MQQGAGRIVRTMYHAMTIHAGTAAVGFTGVSGKTNLPTGDVASGRTGAGMRAIMALVTQERRTGYQQRRQVGAVRVMAGCAVLRGRLMLP